MKRPEDLDTLAADFWRRHASRLEREGLLTPATFDAFCLLCQTFSRLRRFDPDSVQNGWLRYFALVKQYQTMSRGFGMATDKAKESKPPEEPDEFGIV